MTVSMADEHSMKTTSRLRRDTPPLRNTARRWTHAKTPPRISPRGSFSSPLELPVAVAGAPSMRGDMNRSPSPISCHSVYEQRVSLRASKSRRGTTNVQEPVLRVRTAAALGHKDVVSSPHCTRRRDALVLSSTAHSSCRPPPCISDLDVTVVRLGSVNARESCCPSLREGARRSLSLVRSPW
jgi:hypothetical protein